MSAKHFQERRHCWAVMLVTDRLAGFAYPRNGISTVLHTRRDDARKLAKLAGGKVVKVRVQYEVIA